MTPDRSLRFRLDCSIWPFTWLLIRSVPHVIIRHRPSNLMDLWILCSISQNIRKFFQYLLLCQFHRAFESWAWRIPWSWSNLHHQHRKRTWRRKRMLFLVCIHIPWDFFSNRGEWAFHRDHHRGNRRLACRFQHRVLNIRRRRIILDQSRHF